MDNSETRARIATAVAALALAASVEVSTASSAFASPILYGTQNGHAVNGVGVDNLPAIFQYDVGSNTLTTLNDGLLAASAGQMIDGLVIDSQGRFIYSNQTQGTLRRFDPSTGTDTILAFSLGAPRDVVLEPGGNSVLVSETSTGFITRVDLSGFNAKTILGVYGGGGDGPQGLEYVGTRLFANLGYRQLPDGSTLQEIDPATGALLSSVSAAYWGLDGLTFDPFTQRLYSSSVKTNVIYGFNPNNLTGPVATIACQQFYQPDGLLSDGHGSLFIADYENSPPAGHLMRYTFATGQCTTLQEAAGITDLVGSLSFDEESAAAAAVPEPASVWLVGSVLMGLSALRRRRKHASRSMVAEAEITVL